MLKLIIVSIILLGTAFLAIGFNIFFRKGKKFPETEVGRNKNIRELDIHCPKCDEIKRFREMRKKKINPKKLKLLPDDSSAINSKN